jgi:hypothetical protein
MAAHAEAADRDGQQLALRVKVGDGLDIIAGANVDADEAGTAVYGSEADAQLQAQPGNLHEIVDRAAAILGPHKEGSRTSERPGT